MLDEKAEKNKVLPPRRKMPRRPARLPASAVPEGFPAPPTGRRHGRKAATGLFFFLAVLLPTLLTGLYYALVAADQYMVETRFAVRNASSISDSGILSAFGLGFGGVSAGDSYIVLEYIQSREILKRIDAKLDLKERFGKPDTDFYARLPADASMEDMLDYWQSMVRVELDRTSQIITVHTFAFTAEDARDISAAILKESERKINELSARAREDAVAYARQEVEKAERRLREVRGRLLKFRSTTQQIDPAKQAQVQLTLIGKLEEQVAELRAKLAEARSYLSERAPTVIYLKTRIQALQKQIREEKHKLGNRKKKPRDAMGGMGAEVAEDPTLSATLSEYEALLVEREFAEKFYLSTLTGLEQARLLATRQQRYLATFEHPYLPDEAQYPKRIRNTIFVFLAFLLLWALGRLMVQSVRDRM